MNGFAEYEANLGTWFTQVIKEYNNSKKIRKFPRCDKEYAGAPNYRQREYVGEDQGVASDDDGVIKE